MLSEPDGYTGGELQFGDESSPTFKPAAGECIVVAGDMRHRVLPVTGGDRHVLTGFFVVSEVGADLEPTPG